MITQDEKQQFLEQGYLHVPGVLQGEHLAQIQSEFDRVWNTEDGPPISVSARNLLKHPAFVELVEHPPILDRHRAIFGQRVQLLQYDLMRQGPRNTSFPERGWHRDFGHPGDYPVTINTLVFLDDLDEATGPTRVVPGTHRGEALPPKGRENEPLPGEVAVYAKAGDAIFINGAIWHSGARNQGDGQRRGIYLYYGYSWMRRFDGQDQGENRAAHDVPPQALQGAGETRRRLLGDLYDHSDYAYDHQGW